jgi:hypothetical protein
MELGILRFQGNHMIEFVSGVRPCLDSLSWISVLRVCLYCIARGAFAKHCDCFCDRFFFEGVRFVHCASRMLLSCTSSTFESGSFALSSYVTQWAGKDQEWLALCTYGQHKYDYRNYGNSNETIPRLLSPSCIRHCPQ